MHKDSGENGKMQDTLDGVYEILRPCHAAWVVFDSPHSGRTYPADFKHSVSERKMRAAEDSMVDDLFDAVPEKGGIMLRALFPRTYVDLNRYETDIKRQMLTDPHNWPLGFDPTTRSEYGHGIIRESLRHGHDRLYKKPITTAAAMARIENYHRPYHAALAQLIDDAHAEHGRVWHVNCHSMPSACISPARKTDICLGDAFGAACHRREFTEMVQNWLKDKGYRVDINVPFAGYRLVTDYADPPQGRQSLQIEINKAIYWDERKDKPSANYATVKADMEQLSEYIIDATAAKLMPIAAG